MVQDKNNSLNKKTSKPKDFSTIHLRISEELIQEIDQFADEYNFMNRTDAVRFLISSGLKNHK